MKRKKPVERPKQWGGGAALFLLALFAGTLVVYLPAIRGGFIWDDDAYVTENGALRTAEGLRRIWFDFGATPQYYPLTFTSFWVEYHLWDVTPIGYHLVNVFFHAGSAILIWRLLRLLGVSGAWLAAAVFALHPVCIESVAWITERKNTLSVFLALAAAWMFLRWVGFGSSLDQPAKRRRYVAGLGLFIAALLAKSAICTLPAVLLVVLWWKRGRVSKGDWLAAAPWFAASVASGLVTAYVERMHVLACGPDWALGPLERILVSSRAICFYLEKLIWPAKLMFVYPRWSVRASDASQWVYPALVVVLLLLLWRMRRAWGRGPLAAMLIYCGALLPALGLVNIYYMRFSYVADHFQYFPAIAVIVALSAAVVSLIERASRHPGARVLPLVVPIVLAARTWRQCGDYADQETLWRRTLAKNDQAWLAYANLGIVEESRGRYDEAARLLGEAMKIKRDDPHVRHGLAVVLARMDRREESIAQFREALRIAPGNTKARCGYGSVLTKFGRHDEAMAEFREVLRIDAQNPDAHSWLAGLLVLKGKFDEAEGHARMAIRGRPDLAEAHVNLANVLTRQGRRREAIAYYRQAITLDPSAAEPANNLAWLLATNPVVSSADAAEAVRLGEQASTKSRRQDPEHLDTLAAAYAAAGRFGDALTTAREAVAVAEGAEQETLGTQIRVRMKSYEKGERWVERSR